MVMIQEIKRIEYRCGMLNEGMNPGRLPVRILQGSRIKAEVRWAIIEEDLLNLGGFYGDQNACEPYEYDHLKLILTDDVVEITVFNRGFLLYTTEDERIKRIHRVLCKLDHIRKRPS